MASLGESKNYMLYIWYVLSARNVHDPLNTQNYRNLRARENNYMFFTILYV